jgi:hypothetical protein
MVELQPAGPSPSTTATTSASGPTTTASTMRSSLPGVRPGVHPPLSSARGAGPFRWVALSGDPKDIYATDKALLDLFPENEWVLCDAGSRTSRSEKIGFQGLPSRICWLGYGERDRFGLRSTSWSQGRDQRPDRHRPRPPRLRLGREPVPRDRGDEGRQRRDRRLADPQRDGQRRGGRDLGRASTTAAASASG